MIIAHLVLHGAGEPRTVEKEFANEDKMWDWLAQQIGHPFLYYTLTKTTEK